MLKAGLVACALASCAFALPSATEAATMAGNITGTGINPMMMILLSSEGNKKMDSLLPLMLMSQNGGNITSNPMLPIALLAGGDKKEGSEGGFDVKDLLMVSALGGGNLFGGAAAPAAPVAAPAGGLFGNLFSGFAAPAAPAAAPAAAAAPAKKRPAKRKANEAPAE